jgi:hypothetical protein
MKDQYQQVTGAHADVHDAHVMINASTDGHAVSLIPINEKVAEDGNVVANVLKSVVAE